MVRLITVKERLEKLMGGSTPASKSFSNDRALPMQVGNEEDKLITPSKVMQQKIEKSIRKLEGYHFKMHKDSESYLALFYDLKKAEKEFQDLLKEAEDKKISIPSPFMKRIEAVRTNIRNVQL